MFVAPGEVRRRADLVAIVGESARDPPRLRGRARRDGLRTSPPATNARILPDRQRQGTGTAAQRRSQADRGFPRQGGVASAARWPLRAQCAGRQVSAPGSRTSPASGRARQRKIPGLPVLRPLRRRAGAGNAARAARRPQPKSRASALHLPSSESGRGSTLALHLDDWISHANRLRAGFPNMTPGASTRRGRSRRARRISTYGSRPTRNYLPTATAPGWSR